MARIRIANLSLDTTDETLRQTFSRYGRVLDSAVRRDCRTGASKGDGHVAYALAREADAAIAAMNGQALEGRRIVVTATESGDAVAGSSVTG
ncbi:RNA-binding protein [Kitasatospora sp. NPDC056327]|uniref:RNA-binding protein n=1 Tax=Kitasatospora sp. NPDC056327 TaxID=3345785 RepID=UPI0035E2A570